MPTGTSMRLSDARRIDPILTNIAQGFSQAEYGGSYFFPCVEVPVRGGQIISFDKAAFRTYNSRRVPGGNTKRIQTNYTGLPYALDNDGLEHPLPIEYLEDSDFVGIDWQKIAMDACMSGLTNNLEVEQAALLRNPAAYNSANILTLSGGSQLNTAGGAAPFSAIIRQMREAIRTKIGRSPNVMGIPASIIPALDNLTEIRNRLQYTSSASATLDMLAAWYDFDKVVLLGSMQASEDPSETLTDIWGSDIVMAYVNPVALQPDAVITYQMNGKINRFSPSLGYTYTLKGHPFAKPRYWDENTDSWVFGAKLERKPVLTGVDGGLIVAGAIIRNCLA